jgi:hypothetical protein
VGSTWQRGERERGVPVRVRALLGCGLDLVLGQIGSPGSSSIFISFFLLFFSVFFISFKHFSNFESNRFKQLCKVSKIQNNHTEQ